MILMRRGVFNRFAKNKLLPGEWAVVLEGDPGAQDGLTVYMCFAAGVVKRMATYEDMVEQFGDLTDDIIRQLTNEVQEAITRANTSAEYANRKGELAGQNATAAEVATNATRDFLTDLQAKLQSGFFKGETGPQGPPGPQGDSGVMVPVSGMFSLYVDAAGDLYAEYNDDTAPPRFELETDGTLYYLTN